MKKLILISTIIVFALVSCKKGGNTKVNISDTTIMTFTDTIYDFGKVIEGEKVNYTFKFKNTGDKPLLISQVATSCGCTASSYTDSPVKPNSEGYVKVTFNSSGRQGNVQKTITVYSNTKPVEHILIIKVYVDQTTN